MLTIADSIALKLTSSTCLLAGIGNELHQYCLDSSGRTTHQQINLNFNNKIYGINQIECEDNGNIIVVHGGRELAILRHSVTNELELLQQFSISDWINSLHVYEQQAGDVETITFCVLTSHSVALQVSVSISGDWRVLSRSACVDKCTLYCSLIIGTEWNSTTILGGTALGELIIWTISDDDMDRKVLHRLSGHNGVIFSIDCMLRHRLLTTTSDDRSVKIWRLHCDNEHFDWKSCKIESLKSIFGHTARVFRHRIIEHENKPFIISIGEDAGICLWTSDGKLLLRKTIGDGCTLWNLEYDSAQKYVITCGSDGNINQLPLSETLSRRDCQMEPQASLLPGIDDCSGEEEYFTKIRVLQQCELLIGLTSKYNLYYRHVFSNNSSFLKISDTFSETYKSTLLEAHDCFVAIAGYRLATIYRWNGRQFESVLHKQLSDRLIRSLKFIGNSEFIVCDDRGNCVLTSLQQEKEEQNAAFHFTLPASKERWITVAFRHKNDLLLGDRCGSMHWFQFDGSQNTFVLVHTLKNVHGNLGCTCIYPEPQTDDAFHFTTAGHDGTLKTFSLNQAKQKLEIKYTSAVPIAWTDKIVSLGTSSHDTLVAGFNDNHFVTWHKPTDCRFEYECGGGHRYWDLYVDRNHQRCHLYFIRAKRIHSVQFDYTNPPPPFTIAQFKWHNRPCNAVHSLCLPNDRVLLISGGDDNLLRFSEIDATTNASQRPLHLADMILHISNIKAIASVMPLQRCTQPAVDRKWTIFSAGGRAQICVTEIEFGRHVKIREVANFMLRMNDSMRKRWGKSQAIDFDPETRFMNMNAYTDSNRVHLIVGCSDGYLRLFEFTNDAIALIASTFYGRCFLHVHHFRCDQRDYAMTMATDGLISFWRLNSLSTDSKPFFQLRHHDSGVNSFDVWIDESGDMHLATGGDDQSIVISSLKLIPNTGEEMAIKIIKTLRFPHSHTAQVNGVKFAPSESALYTVSVDQTILRVDLGSESIHQVARTCISDAKGMEVIDFRKILVYGCGAQLLSV